MSQNSEQIEAKLCAYLEGELDEHGRAEIEKHLQQNPSHRRLLAEVGKTRNLLRALPREPAPPDICEAFQGQLERSVLLADLDDDGGESSMKISRWPQYLAVAAVVALAAGLGMIVYFGLPSGGPDRDFAVGVGGTGAREDGAATRSITSETGATAAATAPVVLPGGLAARSGLDDSLGVNRGVRGGDEPEAEKPAPESVAKKSMTEDASAAPSGPASGPAGGANDELPVLARRVQESWDTKERERLFAGASAADATVKALDQLSESAMCFVVTSAQPGEATEKIGQELSRLRVPWSAVPRPDANTLRVKLERSSALADGVQPPALRELDTTVLAEQDEAIAPAPGAAASPPPADAVALRGSQVAREPGPAGGAKQEANPQVPARGLAAGANRPETQPDERFAEAEQSEPVDTDSTPRAPGVTFAAADAGRPETLIVARNLTRRQAEVLRTSFGGQAIGLQARTPAPLALPQKSDAGTGVDAPTLQHNGADADRGMATGVGGGGGAATAKSPIPDPVIRHGDALRLITNREQGGQTVTELQVGQNGSVDIPGLGAFQCAGLTVTQLQDRLVTDSGADARRRSRLEISRVEKTKDAAGAAPADSGAVAAVTEANVEARRSGRASADVMLRAGAAPSRATRVPGQQPAAESIPPAPSATPAAPARQSGNESRGGAGAPVGNLRQRQESPGAGGLAPAPDRADDFAQTRQSPTNFSAGADAAPDGEERFDLLIVVRADGTPAESHPAMATNEPGGVAEPSGPIEKFEILMIRLGEAELDSTNVRVGDDGTVDLPRVGRLKAEGLTAADLREQIVGKLRENGESKPASISVRRVGNADAGATDAPAGTPVPELSPGQPTTGTTPTEAPRDDGTKTDGESPPRD